MSKLPQPLFLEEDLFQRGASGVWTDFERITFYIIGQYTDLLFSKRLQILEAMRRAALEEIKKIEKETV